MIKNHYKENPKIVKTLTSKKILNDGEFKYFHQYSVVIITGQNCVKLLSKISLWSFNVLES